MYNEDKVKSNKIRLYNIKSLKHKGVDEVFLKLYGGIMNANFSAVKDILQNELYFEVIDDIDAMLKMGIKSAPMLDVDGELLDFAKALAWVREQ
jgi:hypothetical protein